MTKRLLVLILLGCALLADAAGQGTTIPLLLRQRTEANGALRPLGPMTSALIRYFERETGQRFEPRAYPWRRAVAMATHGEGLLWAIPFDSDSSGQLLYSRPVYTTHVWMVARKRDRLQVNSLQDLKGKTVSAYGGSRYSGEFEQLRGKLFTVQEDPDSLAIRLRKLALGRVDVVLLHSRHDDIARVRSGLEAYFADTDTEILPQPLQDEQICFAVAKDSPYVNLLPTIDQAIARGRASGQIDQMLQLAF
ncbi:substrate-binding periplasmic protein [Chitinimonas sp.]|uniref:substrate-binding periplasmic protein n=1 Tax=Chitinimonas sp. TaxID=1934313 RepID=UPI0035AF6DBD